MIMQLRKNRMRNSQNKNLGVILTFAVVLIGSFCWAGNLLAKDLAEYSLEEVINSGDKERMLSLPPEKALPEFYRAFQKPHWEEFFFALHCADHLGQPLAYDLINLFKVYLSSYSDAFVQVIADLPKLSDKAVVPIFSALVIEQWKSPVLVKLMPDYFT